ncbi:RNA polymerase II subunit 5-mediating protein homolog isoform X2 [Daktulosphaira vitifoliae]|uniref:RNA polymerase II subunit 5-mediating protein homolog isoform X2 n=1 Tax=Daktulosphaira vitifoliae TaxID=58002 RepID=UPI0021AAD6C3|nr:RNA polymerase II subunit 5-mediating protein homolog isoform X2 [Daktulosphaira vitifoliae]
MSNQLRGTSFVQKINYEALEHTNLLEQKWKGYKHEYEDLKKCLEEYPKELSASIMMPIGPKVFVRAQLCNTNEIIIRHGENIFTKQTAFQAKSVCDRQIKRCTNALAAIDKEKNFLSQNIVARHQATTDVTQEIIEPLDEAEEAIWRERHKIKEREYRQQLAKMRKKNLKIENDALKRLEELELLETLEDDLIRNEVNIDSDDSSLNESNDDDDDDGDNVDDDDDDDNDTKELEIVFSEDAPVTCIKKKSFKKRVSFNNDVQIKEFEIRPEEYFIQRKEELIHNKSEVKSVKLKLKLLI